MSGFCVDGLCCDAACTGTCRACANARTGQPDGQCATVTAGLPAASGQCTASPPCGDDGNCGAGGVCEGFAGTTTCGPAPGCSAATITGQGTCASSCVGPQTSCGAYSCDSAGVACLASCASPGDCSTGNWCRGGACAAQQCGTAVGSKCVFVSKASLGANLGGLSGADALCTGWAQAAGIPGTFKAWLSTTTTAASGRLTHSTLPYKTVTGVVIATSWNGLTSGSLASPIDIDETGAKRVEEAWTGTTFDGSSAPADCAAWTSITSPQGGTAGNDAITSGGWSAVTAESCNFSAGLYCLEQ